jgi:hypothetical protein
MTLLHQVMKHVYHQSGGEVKSSLSTKWWKAPQKNSRPSATVSARTVHEDT